MATQNRPLVFLPRRRRWKARARKSFAARGPLVTVAARFASSRSGTRARTTSAVPSVSAEAEAPADPAATAAPAPAPAAPAAPAESPLEVQLAKLKKMKTKELIDEATYATMCKAALDADHAAFLKTLGA